MRPLEKIPQTVGGDALKKMFRSLNPGRSHADQVRWLLDPSPKQDMHIRINVETIHALEDLHVIEPQRGKRRRYGSNTLTSLVNRLLLDEVKRARQQGSSPHAWG